MKGRQETHLFRNMNIDESLSVRFLDHVPRVLHVKFRRVYQLGLPLGNAASRRKKGKRKTHLHCPVILRRDGNDLVRL